MLLPSFLGVRTAPGRDIVITLLTILLATAISPLAALAPPGSSYLGCYVDSDNRIMSIWADGVDRGNSSMTVELCAGKCAGYSLFGVEASKCVQYTKQ